MFNVVLLRVNRLQRHHLPELCHVVHSLRLGVHLQLLLRGGRCEQPAPVQRARLVPERWLVVHVQLQPRLSGHQLWLMRQW